MLRKQPDLLELVSDPPSLSTRSRAVSFPALCCFAIRSSPPPLQHNHSTTFQLMHAFFNRVRTLGFDFFLFF